MCVRRAVVICGFNGFVIEFGATIRNNRYICDKLMPKMNFIEKLPISVLRILATFCKQCPRLILTLRYYRWTHTIIDWDKPKSLQEYIFKLVIDSCKNKSKRRLLADLADKIAVREYVTERIGGEFLPRLLGTWEHVDDIKWDALPNAFAIKTNNGCCTNIIVRDKSSLDIKDERKKLTRWLKFPYGQLTGQLHYSDIPPMILAEELLVQDENPDSLPYDYKFFCFKGEPKFILFYEGRTVNGHIVYNSVYDINWKPINSIVKRPTEHDIPRPKSFEKMLEAAKELSKGFDFVRVDMYDINGKPVFGEMTFTPDVTINFTEDFLKESLKFLE